MMSVARLAYRLIAGLALATGGAASAEWRVARSTHFVVYSDDSEAGIRDLATRLERFDAIVRRLHKLEEVPGQSSNPVTIYVLPTVSAVQKLSGRSDNVAGFYVPRASGSVAFTPRRGSGDGGDNDLKPQTVLFHEYGHHLLLGNSTIAYPAWFTEGYAEFVSTTRLDKTSATIGVAAQHRAYSLLGTSGISIERLFDPRAHKLSDVERAGIYGRGWLLTHYIIFDQQRMTRFRQYLALMNAGTPSVEAATKAFGDLKQLNRDLDRYLAASKIPGMTMYYANLPEVKVTVVPLSPGARALMSYRMQSERGVNLKTATPLYAKAAAEAARYPADPLAQAWLAEMAYDARRDDEAEAAADRALAVDPASSQALIYKAMVRLRRAAAARSADPKVWAEARSWVVKANRLDPDSAEPLALFYRSFLMQRRAPTDSATRGLERAFELMPQDRQLRLALVRQKLMAKDLVGAKAMLRPLAYDPHTSPDSPAVKLLARLDAAADPAAVQTAAKTEEDAEE